MGEIRLILRDAARRIDPATLMASIAFAITLFAANHFYLTPRWPQDLFASNNWSAAPLALTVGLVGLVSQLVPRRFETPAGVVAIFLFVLVYVPTVAITLGQPTWIDHVPEILALSAGMTISAYAASQFPFRDSPSGIIPVSLLITLVLAWGLATAALVATYGGVMSLVGIEGTYVQREIGRATSTWMAYTQTYYLNVICPGLLAFGLVKRGYRWAIAPALVGFVILYAVTAQKMAVFIPVLMIGFAILSLVPWLKKTWIAMSLMSALVVIGVLDYRFLTGDMSLVASIFIHRTFGIPAMTLHWYSEVFSDAGYTLWSHVRGFSLIFSPPDNLANDPLWPNLGFIVGERILGNPLNNVNANLFSSDGMAGGGLVGVILISIVLSAWMICLNFAARGWDQLFSVLVIVPVALTLTNGPLFTVLLSFGGLFWLLAFEFFWRLRSLQFSKKMHGQAG